MLAGLSDIFMLKNASWWFCKGLPDRQHCCAEDFLEAGCRGGGKAAALQPDPAVGRARVFWRPGTGEPPAAP